MGKKIVLSGVDFSQNAVEKEGVVTRWVAENEEKYTNIANQYHFSASSGRWSFNEEQTSIMRGNRVVRLKVYGRYAMNVTLTKTNDLSQVGAEIGTFNVVANNTWQTFDIPTPFTLGSNEYLVVSDGCYCTRRDTLSPPTSFYRKVGTASYNIYSDATMVLGFDFEIEE